MIAIYTRVSSARQLEGHSVPTQIDRLTHLADKQFGEGNYELCLYQEAGLSGELPPAQLARAEQTEQRPELTRLLADAEAGRLDAVFFYSVSRMAREEAVFFPVKKRFDELAIPYRFLDVDVDPTTDEGAMLVGMLGIFAASQLRQHKRRIKDAWAKRREEGYPPGGTPPYGFTWQKRDAVPPDGRRGWTRDPEQARWAMWMKDRYMAGWTTTRIAEELSKLGVARPSGNNSNWDSSAVGKVLKNPFCAGLITHPDGSFTHGQHWDQRLWEPEERGMMVKRLTRNRKVGSTTVKSTHFPLGGIITCGHCGRRLYGATSQSTGKRLYQCRTRSERGKDACVGVGRLAEPIEKAVINTIRELSATEEVRNLALEQTMSLLTEEKDRLAEHRQELTRASNRIQEAINRLTDMRLAGELTAEQYREQNDRLWEQRQDLDKQIGEVTNQIEDHNGQRVELETVRQTLQNFNAVWEALDPDEQQEGLRTVIEYCKLRRAEGEDLVLKLKVGFLPEKQFPMPSYTKRKATTGPDSLTPRELAYLWHRRAGLDDRAMARLWDTTKQNVICKWYRIQQRLNVDTLDEAIDQVAERLDTEKHALPLLGRMNKIPAHRPKFKWTAKRRRILEGLAAGRPPAQIAAALGICTKTLSERIRRMKRYAGAKTIEQLLAWSREAGVLEDSGPKPPDTTA